ncbi:MAG: hypothetical protein AABX74_05915, partial [Nanoarchaeota archaeon]
MDIDEFLDKEMQAEKAGEAKEKAAEKAVEKPEIEEVSNEKKDSVKRFLDLWNKISEAKFKWDEKLYKEINDAGESVKKELESITLAVGRQKKAIKRLIGKALNEIENKNYDAAAKLYSEISDMRDKIPEFMLEEKKDLNNEIFVLYEKLHNNIDAKFIKDFKASLLEVDSFINDSGSAMGTGDIEKAKLLYEKALESYRALPNGFLQKKVELGSKLFGLYKELSIRTQIYGLQEQLGIGNFSYANADRLKKLSEMVRGREGDYGKGSIDGTAINEQHVPSKALLNSLIARKLERARINLEK